jgi:hypothetical protein
MKPREIFPIVLLAALLVLVLAVRSCVNTVVDAPRRGIEQTAAGVRNVFREFAGLQPEVVINQTVIHNQSTSTTELALVQKQTLQDYEWAHRWMGSTKSIRISGTYEAKAGFDLRERFVVTIGPGPEEVTAELPPARLLSIEQVGKLQFSDESGYWNRLTSQDRETALNQAKDAVRAEVLKSSLLKDAEEEAYKQLGELAKKQGLVLKLVFRQGGVLKPVSD